MIKNEKIANLFRKVKLLILDVDGVLTRGEIIYDDRGRELKAFNVKDGLGVYLLGKAGIKTILLSARASSVLKKRALDMRVAEVIGGILPKEKNLERIKKKYKVLNSEICFIGDDLIDIGLMKRVGLSIAVADAATAVKKVSRYVTRKNGGEGAVREIIDLIIKHKKLNGLIEKLLKNPF